MSLPVRKILDKVIQKKHFWKVRLLKNWHLVIGSLKDKVSIKKIEDEFLVLGVEHPVWAQEVRLTEVLLRKKVNKLLKQDRIKKIHVHVCGENKKEPLRRLKNLEMRMFPDHAGLSVTDQEHLLLSKVENKELKDVFFDFLLRCKKMRKS